MSVPTIDNQKLLAQMPGRDFTLPPRLFTPEIRELIGKGGAYTQPFMVGRGNVQRAALWLRVPETAWAEYIPALAPVSCYGSFRGMQGGLCPLCGKPFGDIGGSLNMTDAEFAERPFQATTRCCGKTVFARDADMPADYPAKPNRTEKIAHLDGSLQEYRFFVAPGADTARKDWFSGAGEVWRVRLKILMTEVVPDLATAVYRNNDTKAARQLAVILDRLAEVYPGLPLYDATASHGFARGRDGTSYLTRGEYLAVKRPEPFETPFYWRSAYNFDKLNWGVSGWQDGVMQQVGELAEAFDLLRDRAEVKDYSRERYGGDAGVWEQRIRERLLQEGARMCSAVSDTRGNTVLWWSFGGLKLGIVLQDRYVFNHALGVFEMYVSNGYFSDGLCEEAAFNYAAMMRPFITGLWIVQRFGGVDLRERYPYLKVIEQGDYPITTLYGIESQHADEHAVFMRTMSNAAPPAPDAIKYGEHERAQCYPEYGLTCLRAGVPGHRLEALMDYQSAIGHTHFGHLNLQLFYEGINLLPDMGYGCVVADTGKEPWTKLKYPFDLVPCPDPNDWWGAWFMNWTTRGEAHCSMLVDGSAGKEGPAAFQRFWGGRGLADPAYGLQFAESDALGAYRDYRVRNDKGTGYPNPPGPVTAYHRQLATITLPDGRSLLLDIFRVTGGQRHDLLWHVPAARAETTLGTPETLPFPTLEAYRKANTFPGDTVGPAWRFVNNPVRWTMPDGGWRLDWTVQPSRFAPVTDEGKQRYAPWEKLMHDVRLRMWATTAGSPAKGEVVAARAPWTANSPERLPALNVLAFKDALDYIVESRRGEKPGLESIYLHVLEAFNPDQAPAVAEVERLTPVADSAMGAAALRIGLGPGEDNALSSLQLYAASTPDGGLVKAGPVQMQGRFGVVCPGAVMLNLYDGEALAAAGFGVKLEPGWRLKLLGVLGDLTGSPRESALIVASDQPLPTDATLVGQMLTVNHRSSDLHRIGYTIERVQAFGVDRFRLDLRGTPPFIQHKMRVRKLDAENPGWFAADHQFYKGQSRGLYHGRTIRFPRSGFTCPIEEVPFSDYHGWNSDRVALSRVPAAAEVKIGDPFVIYTIQPGDEVVIPAHFACRRATIGAGSTGVALDVTASGPATLTVPGPWREARLLQGTQETLLPLVPAGATGVSLPLPRLTDGHGTVTLTR